MNGWVAMNAGIAMFDLVMFYKTGEAHFIGFAAFAIGIAYICYDKEKT